MKRHSAVLAAFCLAALAACQSYSGPGAAAPGQPPARQSGATGPFWQAGQLTPAQRFELAKRSTPELIAFLRRLPKGADLHNHLGGATFADYLIESARTNDKRFDTVRNSFTDDNGADTLSMQEFLARPALVYAFRNQLSVRGWAAAGGSGHDHFFTTFSYIGDAGRDPAAMLAEVLARNVYQNVQYLELMATVIPPAVVPAFRAAYTGLNLDDLTASFAPLAVLIDDPALQRQYTEMLDGIEARAFARLAEHHGVPRERAPPTRYIMQLDRVRDLDRFALTAAMALTGIRADPRIVGLNMVAPEDLPTSRLQFDAHMRILDFLWRRYDGTTAGGFDISLHAGELALLDSPVEPMRDRIRRSIDEGHAQRIGHGASVAWETDLVGLLTQMAADGVLVEVIPSSAEVILGMSGRDHPFRMYRDAGVPVCISTDDEAVNRSNLTMEYVQVVQQHDLTYDDVVGLARSCLQHAFVDADARAVLLQRHARALAEFEGALASGFRE